MNHGKVAKVLIDEGLTPGEDFSISDDGGIMMSEKAKEHLKSKLKPEEQERFEIFFERRQGDPWQNLEEHLGVPFFENLKQIVSERIETLNDNQALNYIYHIIVGFEERHPHFKEVFGPWLIQEGVGLDRWKQIDQLIEEDEDNLGIDEDDPAFGIWMIDFIKACGGDHYLGKGDNGEDIVHKDGLTLLEEVFTGNQD